MLTYRLTDSLTDSQTDMLPLMLTHWLLPTNRLPDMLIVRLMPTPTATTASLKAKPSGCSTASLCANRLNRDNPTTPARTRIGSDLGTTLLFSWSVPSHTLSQVNLLLGTTM